MRGCWPRFWSAPGTAWHSTGPAARRPWGFPTCTGLRIPAGQASLGCAYAHPNCPSCAWAVLCIWPTQTQGLLINWTSWLLAGFAHDFTRKLFARKLQARLGHWVYTACAVLGLWCHAAGTIGKIPAWKIREASPWHATPQGSADYEARNTLGIFSIFVCKSFAQKPGSLKNLGLGFWFLRHVGRGRYGHLRDML